MKIVLQFCTLFLLLWLDLQASGQDLSHTHRRRVETQLALARQSIKTLGDDAKASDWSSLGDSQLRAGKVVAAAESFEKAINLEPKSKPYLWQYGIALFFAERFKAGQSLFEQHRAVNPNDVENAAWHFLCVAKATGVGQARKIVLPAPNDPRVPMKEILQRLTKVDDDLIIKPLEFTNHPAGEFYGHLYLGLIADAEGHPEQAKRWMELAAQTRATHYMADVARVYRDHLLYRDHLQSKK